MFSGITTAITKGVGPGVIFDAQHGQGRGGDGK